MPDDFLTQGIAAVKAGNKQEARRLLDAAIRATPNDERTWGWFYNVAANDEERLKCVKEILRINPNNEKAKQKFDELIGLGYQSPAAIPQMTPTTKVTNKKQGLSLEWIVLGSIGGLLILAGVVIGIIFLIGTINSPTVSVPNLTPTQYSIQTILYPSPTIFILPTDTQKPTITLIPTDTPILLTNTPLPPTLTATITFTPSPTLEDDAYSVYLAEKFNKIGDHAMVIDSVDINHNRIAGEDFTYVDFNIGYEEANYLIEEDTSAGRKIWAKALLGELKTHWPKQEVSGSLIWTYDSTSWDYDTDCSTTGTMLFSDGWIHIVYFARAIYSPVFGDDFSCY